MKYNFDVVLHDSRLSRMKWEFELKKSADPDLLSFGTADMDFRSPQPILDAISAIADVGHLGYPYISDHYYSSIENWLHRATGWCVDVRSCAANNVGIYTAVWTILDAFTQLGDEVIIQTPAHFCFTSMVKDNDRSLVENPLREVNGRYEMDFEQLERSFSNKTKLFWLCNPHNPVGRAWTKEELMKLAKICLAHRVPILSDDVYCGLTYPGISYTPIASLSRDISQNTITCYSTSKSYNTTGVKYSFCITENPELLKKYNKSLQKLDLTYGFNIIGIAITEAAYEQCDDWLAELMGYVQSNMQKTEQFLKDEMPRVSISHADSTYFAWMDVSCFHLPADDLVEMLKREAHILVCSGAELGKGGEGHIRFNLACPASILEEGLKRFGQFYQKHLHI
ncbi:MAG TPA: aminotransferase class I/II-fold pyridoxal phosphate-dependent enzyme [Clostridia bacterium]|nr:aminotransferase class I/II-fold pyridoxal phosphate-dependent enzyme [Clostridia bacterium]